MVEMDNDEETNGLSLIVLLIYLSTILVSGSIVLTTTSPQISPYGTQSLAIIPVYFDDQPPVNNISTLDKLIFTDANEHVQGLSYGKTWLEGKVSGWVHLRMSIHTYGESEFLGPQRLVKDAVAAADSTFDFSSCNRVVIVHAGVSWQESSNKSYPSTCWVPLIVPTNDGVTYTEAIVVSELDSSYSLVHELCHGFGAVDLYNLERAKYGIDTNETYIRYWCIMGSGSTEMCLFNKNKIGWIPNDAIFSYSIGSYQLSIISINETTYGFRGIHIDSLNHSGYFLFEARAGKGILATFVDERKAPGNGIVDLVHVKDEDCAYLRIGEAYHNWQNNFTIRVICKTDTGFNVSISNVIGQGVDEYVFSYPLPKRLFDNIDVSESYKELTYAALEREEYLPNGFLRYVEVYRTYNYGRNWEYLYNTSIVGMNCSEPSISILNEQPILFVRSWNSSGIGYLEMFNDTVGNSFLRLVDLNQWRTIQSSSDRENSLVYVTWDDRNVTLNDIETHFGTWNGTYWNASWSSIRHASFPHISPAINGPDSRPFVVYKSGEDFRHVNLSRFGETESIQAWKNESADTTSISGYEVTSLNDVLTISLHEYGWNDGNYTDVIRIIQGQVGNTFDEICSIRGFADPQLIKINTSNVESIWLSSVNRTDGFVAFFNISSPALVPLSTNTDGEVSLSKYSELGLESVVIIVRGTSSGVPVKSLFLFNGPVTPFTESLSYFANDSDFTINPIYLGVVFFCSIISLPAILRRNRILEFLSPNEKEWSMINWFKVTLNVLSKTIRDDIPSFKIFVVTYLVGMFALYISVLIFPTRLPWSTTYLYYWYEIDIVTTLFLIVLWIIIPVLSIRAWTLFLKKYSKKPS